MCVRKNIIYDCGCGATATKTAATDRKSGVPKTSTCTHILYSMMGLRFILLLLLLLRILNRSTPAQGIWSEGHPFLSTPPRTRLVDDDVYYNTYAGKLRDVFVVR